jgi:hypothetical protein
MPEPTRPLARHEQPALDEAALVAARAFDRLLEAAREGGDARWTRFLEPLPDRLRDDDVTALRRTARRCRSAFGPGDSLVDILPADIVRPAIKAIDDVLRVLARLDALTDQ